MIDNNIGLLQMVCYVGVSSHIAVKANKSSGLLFRLFGLSRVIVKDISSDSTIITAIKVCLSVTISLIPIMQFTVINQQLIR